MIGSLELRTAHYLLALGAEDLELGDPSASGVASRWRAVVALVGDSTRVLARGHLGEREIPALGEKLSELLRGGRTAVSFSSEDGMVHLAFERRSPDELGMAVRLVSDPARGAYSSAETRVARAGVEDFAHAAAKFPY
jgi:hypothetical protein